MLESREFHILWPKGQQLTRMNWFLLEGGRTVGDTVHFLTTVRASDEKEGWGRAEGLVKIHLREGKVPPHDREPEADAMGCSMLLVAICIFLGLGVQWFVNWVRS